MIKKYNQYIKETIDRSDIDPYGEEDWETDEEKNLIVATSLGYDDIPFLVNKKNIFRNNRFYDIFYCVAVFENGEIKFKNHMYFRDIYKVTDEQKMKILTGEEKVAYVDSFNRIYTDTLDNLCNIMNVNIDEIKIIN